MKFFLTITTLFLFFNSIGQTQKSLAGFIQDKTGTPLEAVTILIKGTNLGTATDSNGRFLFTLRSAFCIITSLRAVSTILPTINISLKDQLFTLTPAFGHLMVVRCI